MTMEEMFNRIDMFNILIQSFNYKIGCEKIIGWNEFENHGPEYFKNKVDELIGDSDMITTGSWCFDPISYNSLFDAYKYLINNSDYSAIIFPEMNLLLIGKNKEVISEAFAKLPGDVQEKAMLNIIASDETVDGVTFTYTNRVSFLNWLERPEYVYDIINNERANEQ